MKYWRFIIIGLTLILLLYYFFTVYRDDWKKNAQVQQNQTTSKQWEEKTDEQEPILIKVTPLELGLNQSLWKFRVIFTTHLGNLDQDPTKVVVLVDDKGSIYQPVAWEGPGPGGHHREGILEFNTIQPNPKYVELKIKDVGGIPERSFKWNLE